MDSLTISVVICCYADERRSYLDDAIDSIRNQTRSAHDVVVVVDHNTALYRSLKECHSNIILVENEGPSGLSASRDQGVSVASGDIVAFLDDDALASADWLARLTHHYRNPKVLGVGGAIAPLWDAGQPASFPSEFYWVVGCSYRGMPEYSSDVRNLIGCNMSFRSDVFGTIGGFRVGIGRVKELPVGGEETDFCIRLRRQWPEAMIIYDPEAMVHHHVPSSRSSWRYFSRRCFAEGKSKAILSRLLGRKSALESEREYTRQVLPNGALSGLRDAILKRDVFGLGRAFAIVAGFMITSLGYATGTMSQGVFPPLSDDEGASYE